MHVEPGDGPKSAWDVGSTTELGEDSPSKRVKATRVETPLPIEEAETDHRSWWAGLLILVLGFGPVIVFIGWVLGGFIKMIHHLLTM